MFVTGTSHQRKLFDCHNLALYWDTNLIGEVGTGMELLVSCLHNSVSSKKYSNCQHYIVVIIQVPVMMSVSWYHLLGCLEVGHAVSFLR